MARALDQMGVPTTMVLDSGAAYCMERCPTVLCLVSNLGRRAFVFLPLQLGTCRVYCYSVRTLSMLAWSACRVDMVLVGAEGVVENGGVINKLGTYQIALCAKTHSVPVYVAAESYKVCLRTHTRALWVVVADVL